MGLDDNSQNNFLVIFGVAFVLSGYFSSDSIILWTGLSMSVSRLIYRPASCSTSKSASDSRPGIHTVPTTFFSLDSDSLIWSVCLVL